MKQQIFCVLDMVAERYLDPFFTINTATAIRSFARACEDPQNGFAMNPQDYVLYHIGEWDADLAELTPLKPRKVAQATDYTKQPQLLTDDQVNGLYEGREVDRVHAEGRA